MHGQILIIEDEKKIADTLQLGLSEQGYEVEVAYDGDIGLKVFLNGHFDLLILDINLPGMNGFDDKVEGYDAGADDYLVKPFEFKELLLKIRVLLKRSLNQQLPVGNILKAADLSMNLDSKEVFRNNQKIKLTAKEFQLLEYLLRNRNRVVSRADLAINVWDIDFDTNTNVIDVYISYVRNKVDKNFEHKLIQTHVGMGYVLKDHL